MNRILAFLLTGTCILGLGLAHGRLTDRWGLPANVAEAAGQLNSIPDEIGGWVVAEDREIPDRTLEAASAEGYLSRLYVDNETGESVSVMILCGRPGPISVHPPTVCFVGAGVRQETAVEHAKFAAGGTESDFKTAVFVHTDVFESAKRTYWAWSPDGELWTAPDGEVRTAFAGEPLLYKLYVTTPVERQSGSEEYEQTRETVNAFIESLLAVLSEQLPRQD